MADTIPIRAGGNINTCVFVKPDSSHANGAVLAVDGSIPVLGISTEKSRVRPDPDFSAATIEQAAQTGEILQVYPNGTRMCSLYCNAAWNPGDLLMPDASGFGIVATTTNYYGARALTAGVVGTLCPVMVEVGYQK